MAEEKKRVLHTNFKEVKEWLRAKSPLRLSKGYVPDTKSPLKFAQYFLQNAPATYYAKSGKLQCYAGAQRTVGDAFRVTYYYFPKVKLITIYRAIFDLMKNGGLTSSICSTVMKRVYQRSFYKGICDQAPTDELGFDFTKIPEFKGISYGAKDNYEYMTQYKIPGAVE